MTKGDLVWVDAETLAVVVGFMWDEAVEPPMLKVFCQDSKEFLIVSSDDVELEECNK